MALEAISTVTSSMGLLSAPAPAQTPTPSQTSTAQLVDANATKSSEAADSFRETLGSIHDSATRFQTDPVITSKMGDPVEAAKASILPSPWMNAPSAGGANAKTQTSTASLAGAGASNGANPPISLGNEALKQSFDHAVFVTLVSQVIGGVSQTTSTLIKQQ